MSAKPQSAETGEVAGVLLTHPDRVVYPELGLTKRALALYYAGVAERLLPHVRQRPVTIVRCPRGRAQRCFYQKHATESLPASLGSIAVVEQDGTQAEYLRVDDVRGLVELVQIGMLELHPWGSRADRLERPDRLVLDLDPGPGVPWGAVVRGARELRAILESLGLVAFARTTGGKGLHVVVPLERRSSWSELKDFSRALAVALERRDPQAYLTTASKAKRPGRIFVDWLRNARGATAVASYSARARAGAPVACPLTWRELDGALDAQALTVASLPARLAQRDPWEGFFELRQALTRRARTAVLTI